MAVEFFLGLRFHVNALTLLILINTATSIQIICAARGFWPYYSGTSNHLYCKPTPCFTQQPCKLLPFRESARRQIPGSRLNTKLADALVHIVQQAFEHRHHYEQHYGRTDTHTGQHDVVAGGRLGSIEFVTQHTAQGKAQRQA